MFGFFKKTARVGGDIRRYKLDKWWFSDLSEVERDRCANMYRPLGTTGRPLIEGDTTELADAHRGIFLANLSTWLAKPPNRELSLKIARAARKFRGDKGDPVQVHFMYANLCKTFYRWREDDSSALEEARWACEEGIKASARIDPRRLGGGSAVSHHCYKQLAIIEEKDSNFKRAITLCKEAKKRGWAGDWDKRIVRLTKKRT